MSDNENYKYSSFDFMKIFKIKRGSWHNLKSRFNLDEFSISVIENNKSKKLYNEKAFEILKNHFGNQVVEEMKENPKMLLLVQENSILKNSLLEYKEISSKFENMYNVEKERNLSIVVENTQLKSKNEMLSAEVERLKNRSIFDRLFNRF